MIKQFTDEPVTTWEPDHWAGPIERWRICCNSHCAGDRACRSPNDCSGTGKNLTPEQHGFSRSIQRMRMIVEEDMPPVLAVSELDLMEQRLSNLRGVAGIQDADALEEILSRVNFDGIDPNGITIGELRRALPKASSPRRSPAHCQTCGMTDREYSIFPNTFCPDPWHAGK